MVNLVERATLCMYHSKCNCKSRGVAILVHNRVQFVENEVILDKNGRFVTIKGKLFGIPVVLANVFVPNWDDVTFFECFFSHLPALESKKWLLRGDFNLIVFCAWFGSLQTD